MGARQNVLIFVRRSGCPLPVAIEIRTIHHGANALLSQALAEPLHGGFRSAPFGGIIFSQQMNHAHGCAFVETAADNSYSGNSRKASASTGCLRAWRFV